jgi:hypothetical protein
MFVRVDRSLVASNDAVMFGLNKEGLGSQCSPPCKEDIDLSLRKDMQQILPLLLCASCKEFLQQRCVSHVNLIMGCVVEKLKVGLLQFAHYSGNPI